MEGVFGKLKDLELLCRIKKIEGFIFAAYFNIEI